MKKSKQYILRIAGGILILFILFWLIISVLVNFNTDKIHAIVIGQINKQVKGDIHVGHLSLDFFSTFPDFSLRLSDVTLRDSLWNQHHHDFFKADNVYACLRFRDLLSGKLRIGQVIIDHGFIYLFTDDCGYCNLNRTDDISFQQGQNTLPDFKFEHTRLIIENESLNSYHDFDFDKFDCKVGTPDSGIVLKINMNAMVHGFSFNMDKGSYLKDKRMAGEFILRFFPGHKIELDHIRLNIDHHPFMLSGHFYFDSDPFSYDIAIQTKKILYSKAKEIMPQDIRKKCEIIDFLEPFDIEATLSGQTAPEIIPKIIIQFSLNDTKMETSFGPIMHCSYTGTFTNQVDSLQMPGDENSKFNFNHVSGSWFNIPLSSSSTEIINLIQPHVICDLKSAFEFKDLNEVTKSSAIRFLNGTGNLDVLYSGSLTNQDTITPQLTGTLLMQDVELNYLPRNLVFRDCNGLLEFKDKDLIINHLLATSGQTQLKMNGNVNNFLASLNTNPDQLTMAWNISTPDLSLNDFVSYVGQRTEFPGLPSPGENKIKKTVENINRMLSEGTAQLNVTADKMTYKKFAATNVSASVRLSGNKVTCHGVRLNHAGGTILLNGSLTNENHANLLSLESKLDHVDIPRIFHAFDNFGQDAITDQNMKGIVSANINVSGVLKENAEIRENSIVGSVEFVVKNGELINFDPAIKIASTAFKKRDFSDIQFAELSNVLDINGSTITVHKMEIRSNVVILFVEGIYDTKTGTDMSIQVPISNLTNTEHEIIENKGHAGMNIRLRAKTDTDGKLKVSWDPFNKQIKRKK